MNVMNGQRPCKEQGTSPATKVGFLTNRWFDPRRLSNDVVSAMDV